MYVPGTPRPKQSVIGVSESTAVETVVEVRSDFTAVTAGIYVDGTSFLQYLNATYSVSLCFVM